MRLAGKTIFISGATSPLGGAIAASCAAAGARLVICGRNEANLDRLSAEVGSAVIERFVLDLDDTKNFQRVITSLHGRYSIAGFVHAAGLHEIAPLKVTQPDRIMRSIQVNTIAGIELSRLLAHRRLIDESSGSSHLFLSSVASHKAESGLLAYATAKAALNAASRSLAIELASKKVRVNVLTLGWINTPAAQRTLDAIGAERAALQAAKYPLGFGRIEDVTAAALFMLSDESRWMTGSELRMDGGLLA